MFLERFVPGVPAELLGVLALAGGLIGGEVAHQAGGDAPAPDLVAVDRFVETQARRARIPSVALAIADGQGVVHVATYAGGGVTSDTPFLIGSVTKTFTALAVAQLVDAGMANFDDRVDQHIPGFALKHPEASRGITIRHLLTHTSGLSQWSGHDRRAQREARFDHIAAVRPPGKEFEYSSLNYIILGQLVEAVSGAEYSEYVERHIFAPLRMKHSFADPEAARHDLVQGHWYLFGLAIPRAAESAPAPLVPAGFLAGSVSDLANYLSMWLNEGEFEGRRIVSREILAEMFSPWHGGETGAAMAWGIGRTRIGHAGNTRGFSARLALLPAEGYGVAVLANVNSGPFFAATGDILDGVAGILQGENVEPGFLPGEILLKLALLLAVVVGLARMLWRMRAWAERGYPARLGAKGRVLRPLMIEIAFVLVILFLVPRWIGVPLSVIVEYFPDLGIAIYAGVISGLVSATLKAFLLKAEEQAVTAS